MMNGSRYFLFFTSNLNRMRAHKKMVAPEEFTDHVVIQGSEDVTQLLVRGHVSQTQPLQEWQNSAGDPLVRVTGDGRVQVGDFDPLEDGAMATADALIEAYRDESSTKPQRGLNLLGRIGGALAEVVSWAVHELELLGGDDVSGPKTTFRTRLTNRTTGDNTQAQLRAAEMDVVNEAGSVEAPVGQAIGARIRVANSADAVLEEAIALDVGVHQDSGGVTTSAYGLRIGDIDQATNNYAIHTGAGIVHLGDVTELALVDEPPDPAVGVARLYGKPDGKLYAKAPNGEEYGLSGQFTPSNAADWNGHVPTNVYEAANLLARNLQVATAVQTEKLLFFEEVMNGYGMNWQYGPHSVAFQLVSPVAGITFNRVILQFLRSGSRNFPYWITVRGDVFDEGNHYPIDPEDAGVGQYFKSVVKFTADLETFPTEVIFDFEDVIEFGSEQPFWIVIEMANEGDIHHTSSDTTLVLMTGSLGDPSPEHPVRTSTLPSVNAWTGSLDYTISHKVLHVSPPTNGLSVVDHERIEGPLMTLTLSKYLTVDYQSVGNAVLSLNLNTLFATVVTVDDEIVTLDGDLIAVE